MPNNMCPNDECSKELNGEYKRSCFLDQFSISLCLF